jgi:5-methylcytosine-specific restriction endonuclease McrA
VSKYWDQYPIPWLGAKGRPYKAYKLALRNDPCFYCSTPSEGLDHITPQSKGGANNYTNVIGACSPCNSRKADRTLLEFMLAELDRRVQLKTLKEDSMSKQAA